MHCYLLTSSIKYPNGLWYYSIDLAEKKGLVILGAKHQKDWFRSDVIFENITFPKRLSVFIGKGVLVKPTLRPIIALQAKKYVIIHDEWPLRQKNQFKRIIAQLIFYYVKLFCAVVAISDHGGRLFNTKLVWKNNPVLLDIKPPLVKADFLIVGLETERKRLGEVLKFLDKYRGKDYCVVFVGELKDPCLKRKILESGFLCMPSSSLGGILPRNPSSTYISFSECEGFNRGASFAKGRNFNLLLSDIPVHREFFPEAKFIRFN